MSSFREYKDGIASRAHLVKDTLSQLPTSGIVIGTTCYVKSNDRIYIWNGAGWYTTAEVELVVPAWIVDVTQITYDNISINISNPSNAFPATVVFNNDGTKMYVLENTNDNIFQYSLATAFDLSTASYDNVSLNVTSQDSSPYGLAFSNDGTKMYVLGVIGDLVYQYSLSPAFDLSTASYDNVSFDPGDNSPKDLTFNDDGTKMYVVGGSTDAIYQFSLATAFDLSTASNSADTSIDVSSVDTNPHGVAFNENGTKMYFTGAISDAVHQYSLSSAYDISTASYDNANFDFSSQDTLPLGLTFSADGTKMYVTGGIGNNVYQYSTGL